MTQQDFLAAFERHLRTHGVPCKRSSLAAGP
jgi:hypothetical protein